MKPYYKNELTTIYNGDCLNVMKNITDKVDLIITSPPYNIIRPNCTDRGYDLYKDRIMTNEEYYNWIVEIFKQYNKLLNEKGVVIFNMSYGAENTEVMSLTIAEILKQTEFSLADIIVWKKRSATPNNVSKNRLTRIVEFVYIFVRKDELMTFETNKKAIKKRDTGQMVYENIFNFITANNNDGSTDINKATFSTNFVNQLLDIYYVGGIVLDNFSGTGTTSNACEQRNIKNIAIELSKQQCEYHKKRISKIQTRLNI